MQVEIIGAFSSNGFFTAARLEFIRLDLFALKLSFSYWSLAARCKMSQIITSITLFNHTD